MSKPQDYRKNKKTAPQKTAKEKKQAKREKKKNNLLLALCLPAFQGLFKT